MRWYKGYLTLHSPSPPPPTVSAGPTGKGSLHPTSEVEWGVLLVPPPPLMEQGRVEFLLPPEATSGVSQHSASPFLGVSWPSRSWAYTPSWSPCSAFSKRAKVGWGGASFYPIHLQRDPVNTFTDMGPSRQHIHSSGSGATPQQRECLLKNKILKRGSRIS